MRQQACGAHCNQGRRSLQGHASRAGRGELQAMAELQRIVPPATLNLTFTARPAQIRLLFDDEEFLSNPIAAVRGTWHGGNTANRDSQGGSVVEKRAAHLDCRAQKSIFWDPWIYMNLSCGHMGRFSQLRGQPCQGGASAGVRRQWYFLLLCPGFATVVLSMSRSLRCSTIPQ